MGNLRLLHVANNRTAKSVHKRSSYGKADSMAEFAPRWATFDLLGATEYIYIDNLQLSTTISSLLIRYCDG